MHWDRWVRWSVLFILVGVTSLRADVEVSTTRPAGLLSFVQAMEDERSAFFRLYESSRLKTRSHDRLFKNWQRLALDPEVFRLLWIQAAFSEDLSELRQRSLGQLAPQKERKVFELLEEIDSIYGRLIWRPSKLDLQSKVSEVKILTRRLNLPWLFDRLIKFYQSPWSTKDDFYLTLYPQRGMATPAEAQALQRLVLLGLSVEAEDTTSAVAKSFEAFANSLFASQTLRTKKASEAFFLNEAKSPYAPYAFEHLQPSIAEAIAEGWVFSKLERRVNPKAWSTDPYTDAFAKKLYPEIESYLESHKSMDEDFYQKALKIFEEAFPDAILRFDNLFSDLLFVSPSEAPRREVYLKTIKDYFNVEALVLKQPQQMDRSLRRSANPTTTLVSVFEKIEKEDLLKIREFLPSIEASEKILLSNQTNVMVVGREENSRAFAIIKATDQESLHRALARLKSQQKLDPKNNLQRF